MTTAPVLDADPGLFGPDSVTWRIHADPIMPLAGVRALLFQALHPLAMAGVAQFSDYRSDPWGRLLRTAEFVARTTYGTSEEAEGLGATVREVHSRLAGVEPESRVSYRVGDPHLLRWVHVCEAQSFLTTFRRAGGHLASGEADRYYDEMRTAAKLVGCPDAPGCEADVEAYLHDMRPELRLTKAARDGAFFLINPPMPRWVQFGTPAKPAWWALGALGVSTLPRWARRMYMLPGLPTTDLGATVGARSLRLALRAIPSSIREGPAVKQARARLNREG